MENNDFLSDAENDNLFESEINHEAESSFTEEENQKPAKPSETIPRILLKENIPAESEQPEQQTLSGDPFEAALKKSAEKSKERLIGILAEKKPVFKYGSVSEPITDEEITFEELRKKYETDFPELEEKQNVNSVIPKRT